MASEIRVNQIQNRSGLTTTTLVDTGVIVSGIVTANSFSGNVTGGTINATSGTITGNLGVGGVLTYEDVSNVDSVGVITARQGIRIGAGKSIGSDGAAVVYYGDGSNLTGAGPTLTNGADNRVITATSASAITGEANLTFNGGETGDAQLTVHAAEANANSDSELILETSNDFATSVIMFKDSTAEAGSVAYNHGDNYIKFSTNGTDGGTERMRISSQGYVTKPNQPSFHSRRTSNASSTANPLVYDDAHHNNGSHYKTSGSDQGKFVAPVAGVYLFYWCAIKTNAGSVCRLYINKNGSKIYNEMHLRLQESGTYSNGSMQAILNLSSGDKVHISLEAGSIHGSEYTHFGGYLIG